MKIKKKIVDTTLRDGEQCPGIVFRPEDKIRLGLLLDALGVYEIEAGCVDIHSDDLQYIGKLMGQKRNALVSLWCRMRQEDVEEACLIQPDLIHIGVPVSYVQIYSKLNKNKVWVQREIKSCLEIANNYGIPVSVGLEDATRADIGFILTLVRQLYAMGVKTVRIADTVGTLTPDRGYEIVKQIHGAVRELNIEIHEHNDLGMAVANSIVMAKAGGTMIDCTLLGIGERVGNCNLYDFVHATETIFDLGIDKKKIKEVEQELIEILTSGVDGGVTSKKGANMRFFVLADNEDKITDFFHVHKLIIYEKILQWEPVGEIQIGNIQNITRSEIESLSEKICTIIKEQDSELLIGTAIVGLPYQILNKNGIIMCEAEELSQRLFDEIYDDFYNNIAFDEEEQEDIRPYPVCIAEDGFYYFDFDKAMKAHPSLSSKKMLIPFLEQELYTCLTIRCSHIMPWLDYYTEQHGLSMDSKREDEMYIVNIMHGLCERVGECNE